MDWFIALEFIWKKQKHEKNQSIRLLAFCHSVSFYISCIFVFAAVLSALHLLVADFIAAVARKRFSCLTHVQSECLCAAEHISNPRAHTHTQIPFVSLSRCQTDGERTIFFSMEESIENFAMIFIFESLRIFWADNLSACACVLLIWFIQQFGERQQQWEHRGKYRNLYC